MRLILVRHGETVWNAEFRVQGGNADTALSEKGQRQVARLAEVMRHEPIDLIVSSPLQRAVITAQTIGQYHTAPIETHPGLKEVNVGEFDGLSTVGMPQTFTELLSESEETRDAMRQIVDARTSENLAARGRRQV